jgi:hypothetical protein
MCGVFLLRVLVTHGGCGTENDAASVYEPAPITINNTLCYTHTIQRWSTYTHSKHKCQAVFTNSSWWWRSIAYNSVRKHVMNEIVTNGSAL